MHHFLFWEWLGSVTVRTSVKKLEGNRTQFDEPIDRSCLLAESEVKILYHSLTRMTIPVKNISNIMHASIYTFTEDIYYNEQRQINKNKSLSTLFKLIVFFILLS